MIPFMPFWYLLTTIKRKTRVKGASIDIQLFGRISMIQRVFGVVCLSMLLTIAVFAMRAQSTSELTEVQLKALPDDLRTAALHQRETRLRMSGSAWVFAFSGSSEAVTDGDVAMAKVDLALAANK
jgi:hypothetical protein